MLLVVLGLTAFIRGVEMGLFPIGENMAYALARRGRVFWLLFNLGYNSSEVTTSTITVPLVTALGVG